MTKYNYYIGNRFSTCRLLAVTRDVYRDRNVSVYMIPGEFSYVGVSDGTDCWIAPVIADPFSVKVAALLSSISAGGDPAVVVDKGASAETTHSPQSNPARRRLNPVAAPRAGSSSGDTSRRRRLNV